MTKRNLFLVIALVLCLAAVLSLWPQREASVAPSILSKEEKEETPLQVEIITFKPEVKKKLGLPRSVREDSHQHVIAASRVGKPEHSIDISAVLDDQSHEVILYEKRVEQSFITTYSHGRVGVVLGVSERLEPTLRVWGTAEMAQIRPLGLELKVGAYGSMDLSPNSGLSPKGLIGVGVWGDLY